MNKDGSIDIASIRVNAEIVSFNSDADLFIQRQQFPEISVDGQTYNVRAVKISFGRAFLDRAKRELSEGSNLNKNALGDPTVKVVFVNDDNQDVILTGYNLWLNEKPVDVVYQKKVAPLEKVELKFSQVTGQLVGRGDAPIVFLWASKNEQQWKTKDRNSFFSLVGYHFNTIRLLLFSTEIP